ncbi:hypothetical protein L1887_44304 [Cichorium endivia]|nr:hypothetical protein L1887_44304 [Cichorium endivia]
MNILINTRQDHKIRIWKINELKVITTLPTLKYRLTKILFAKNYIQILRHKKLTWIHHNDDVSSLAVSMDKTLIYSASWDRSFKVWRSTDFKCLESTANSHDNAIKAFVLSDEGFVYTVARTVMLSKSLLNPLLLSSAQSSRRRNVTVIHRSSTTTFSPDYA